MEKIRIKSVIESDNNRDLDIDKAIKDGDLLRIFLKTPVSLKENDIIFLQRKYFDDRAKVSYFKLEKYRIVSMSEDGKTLEINFPYRDNLIIENIDFPEKEEKSEFKKKQFKITFNKEIGITQTDFLAYDGKNGIPDEVYLSKMLVMEANDIYGDHYIIDSFYIYDERNYDKYSPLYDDFITTKEVYCNNFDTDLVPGSVVRFFGSDFFYTNDPEGKIYKPFSDFTRVFYSENYMTIPIMVHASEKEGLHKEESIHKIYAEEIRQDCVPEFIDMEKSAFEPYYKSGDKYVKINKIKINPHFRKRPLSGWNTQDDLFWEQSDRLGEFSEESLSKGDSLYSMNLFLDDVQNKKKKVSKSFFRLSFYDKNDPLGQMLLYYSTVFLDENELYGTVITHYKELYDSTKKQDVLDKRYAELVRCEAAIEGRGNVDKSSEGFYVYLFPDDYKKAERDIYMKVEFNHAGVGKTIPLMLPSVMNVNGRPPLNFRTGEENEYDVDIQKYFRTLYIPLKAKFEETLGKYIYIFTEGLIEDGDTLVLNVFEPKVN